MMRKLLAPALSLLFAVGTFQASAQWTAVGPNATVTTANVAYPSLAKDNANNLYVSYSTGATGGYVQKYDGTNWNILGTGAATPGSASYGSIGVTGTSDVYYGFQDGANGNKLSVRKYTNSTSAWTDAGVAISDYVVNYQQLKVSAISSTPVVSYYQSATATGIFVKRYTGTGWVNVGANQSIAAGVGGLHSVALGSNDTVFVAVMVGTAFSVYKAHVSAVNASDWVLVGTAGFTTGGNSNQFSVSLAADQNNNLYMAYRSTAASAGASKIDVYKYSAGVWAPLGTTFFSTGNVEHISITVSPTGTPFVAYRDNTLSKSVVFTYDGTTWQNLGITSANIGNWSNILLNNAGEPITSFADGTGASSGVVTVKKYMPPAIVVDSVKVGTVGNVAATITTNAGTLPMTATVYPLTVAQTVTWSIVSGTGTASISATGVVNALTNGTVWAKAVSAINTSKKDSMLINISNQVVPIDSIRVRTQSNVAALITTNAGTLQMTSTIYPAAANQAVTWSIIPGTGTASINTSGLVTATTNGTVWAKAIAVSNATRKDSMLVTISNQVVPIDSIRVRTQGNVAALITTNAGTLQMTSTIYPAAANQAVTWSIIPGTGTASINTSGLVTATTNGTVWAKAFAVSDVTKKDSVLVTISNQVVPIDSIRVRTQGNVAALITTNAGTLQMTSTIYPAAANQAVTWSIIPGTGTATINTSGLVTATTNGTVWAKAIAVTDATKKDSMLVTISNQHVGVTTIQNRDGIKVYPNPTDNYVTISLGKLHAALNIKLMDVTGRLLINQPVGANALNTTSAVLNIEQLPAGSYVLTIQGSDTSFTTLINKK